MSGQNNQINTIAANVNLSNLSAVAINTALIPDSDNTIDLGTAALRWRRLYTNQVRSSQTNADTVQFQAYDSTQAVYSPFIVGTVGATPTLVLNGQNNTNSVLTPFVTITNGNPPTCVLDSSVTGGSFANKALSNLSSVAINTALIPASDNTIALGSVAKRMQTLYATGIATGITNGQALNLYSYDTTLASYVTFFQTVVAANASAALYGTNNSTAALTAFLTITNGNPPTCTFDGSITSVTQSQQDYSTKLATTEYSDRSANPLQQSLQSSNWYAAGAFGNYTRALTNFTLAAGTIYYIPFFCNQSYSAYKKISIYVVTGVAASNITVGLYNDAGFYQPTGSPIANTTSGSMASTASANVLTYNFAADVALKGGRLYWVAFSGSSASLVVQATTTNGNGMPSGGPSGGITTANNQVGVYTQARAYSGTLPSASPGAIIAYSAASQPLIYIGT